MQIAAAHKLPLLLLSLSVSLAVLGACAVEPAVDPTLEDALEAHIEAVGGREALESLVVIEREGQFTLRLDDQAYSGSYHTCVRYPDRVAVAIDAGPVQVHQVLGDHGAFECDQDFTECRSANAQVEADLVDTATIANREQLYMEIPGINDYSFSKSNGGLRFDYELDGIKRGIEFDEATRLIRWLKRGAKVRTLRDWRTIGAVMLPFSIIDNAASGEIVEISLTDANALDSLTAWCEHAFARGID